VSLGLSFGSFLSFDGDGLSIGLLIGIDRFVVYESY